MVHKLLKIQEFFIYDQRRLAVLEVPPRLLCVEPGVAVNGVRNPDAPLQHFHHGRFFKYLLVLRVHQLLDEVPDVAVFHLSFKKGRQPKEVLPAYDDKAVDSVARIDPACVDEAQPVALVLVIEQFAPLEQDLVVDLLVFIVWLDLQPRFNVKLLLVVRIELR